MGDRADTARDITISRRRRLAGGAAAIGAAGAAWSVGRAGAGTVAPDTTFGAEVVPFHGVHQAGIQTPPQAHALFTALDLRADSGRSPRQALTAVLRLWTADAERLTQGRPALADTEPELAHRPARLTVTVGLGPELFDKIGMSHARPPSARQLPAFTIDRLDPRWCGGDLFLQICADDPMVVAHTARVLLKNVRTLARPRWRQVGFRTARGADAPDVTMRNLFGQVDGTVNPDEADFAELVWMDGRQQPWSAGGSLAVVRRIAMNLDTWDELGRDARELTVGRRLDNGAPLTGRHETDEPDLTMLRNGIPVIPPNSHVARARHRTPEERFLRRSYNYDDPPADDRTSDAGLIFVSYQRDIDRQFLPVQQRLADADALNEWTTPIGSAVFVILPGVAPGGYLGESLLSG